MKLGADNLQVAAGALAILEERALALNHPALAQWTALGKTALRAQAAREAAMRERFEAALASIDLPATASKADMRRALLVAQHLIKCALAVAILAGAVFGDDDLPRRAPRGGRRRDEQIVAICDGETGDDCE